MITQTLKKDIKKDDDFFVENREFYKMPEYTPENHFWDLTNFPYFKALLTLRHHVKMASDLYFGSIVGAKNIDLFMLTPSVSSPMGPGSDSAPILIQFGKHSTNLVDSSQFGFEPLLLNGLDKVYCYLPSMRGEDPDARHLNQFFHCEAEIVGTLEDLLPIVEGYIKTLAETLLANKNIISAIAVEPEVTRRWLKRTVKAGSFPRITFDDAIKLLVKNNKSELVNFTDHGRDISSKGELELMKILKVTTPIWVTNYDRDRVPFYQKPDPDNSDSTINADLLFPPIIAGSFGGEIVGSGQRQDNAQEMYESLLRQNGISPEPYEWYIRLRKHKKYRTSAGFGMGVERFLAWALGKSNIRDVIIYPRLKNIITYP